MGTTTPLDDLTNLTFTIDDLIKSSYFSESFKKELYDAISELFLTTRSVTEDDPHSEDDRTIGLPTEWLNVKDTINTLDTLLTNMATELRTRTPAIDERDLGKLRRQFNQMKRSLNDLFEHKIDEPITPTVSF